MGTGEIFADPAREIDFESLSIDRGHGLRFCCSLRGGDDDYSASEAQVLHELLARRASIRTAYYEPVSAPTLLFQEQVSEFSVVEIEAKSHLVVGGRRWFLLPQDRAELVSDLARSYAGFGNSQRAESELRAKLTSIHPRLAAVL
jgi:hypothetical protein